MVKAVYIHIPFCKHICSYCDFCKFYYNEEICDKYLDYLEKEVDKYYKGETISTIYIGGGTPSDLSIKNLEKLFSIISKFKLEKNYEFTFECNFSIDKKHLLFLKEHNVNRLSFGIETVNKKYLDIIERESNKEEIVSKIKYARSIGFNNINGDLMYAFKDEVIADVKDDLDFILSLNLEHISTYSLIIEEHTKLFLNNFKNCSEEMDSKMYYYIHDTLVKNNYIHYEISNFSKDGYESKHNSVYWNNLEYYGFGVGASGYIDDIRYSNTKSFNNYFKEKFQYTFEKLEIYDKMSYEMILGLRKGEGINIQNFYSKYHMYPSDVFDYNDLIDGGYLILKNDNLFIPHDKWYVMDSIIIRFVRS